MSRRKYQPGDVFGEWVLVKPVGGIHWRARCSCKKVRTVVLSHLTGGKSTRCRDCYAKTQGSHWRTTKDSTYAAWARMRQNCMNRNSNRYLRYGGAGIGVTQRWDSFENFLEDMGDKPPGTVLTRIDPSREYCKENCRWGTAKESQNNRREQKRYTHDGHTLTIPQWAERVGMKQSALRARLARGWDFADAITAPNVQGCRGYKRKHQA